MSKERRRKAGLESVDSVNGKNRRTCKKLDRLGTGVRMGHSYARATLTLQC